MANGTLPSSDLTGPLARLWRSVYRKAAEVAQSRAAELLREHVYLFHRTLGLTRAAADDLYVNETGDTMTGRLTGTELVESDFIRVEPGGYIAVVPGETGAVLGRLYGEAGGSGTPELNTHAVPAEYGVRFTPLDPLYLTAVRWYRVHADQPVPGLVRLWDTTTEAVVWTWTDLSAFASGDLGWREEFIPEGFRHLLIEGRDYVLSYPADEPYTSTPDFDPVPDAPLAFVAHVRNYYEGLFPDDTIDEAKMLDLAVGAFTGSAGPVSDQGAIRLGYGHDGAIGWRNEADNGDNLLFWGPGDRFTLTSSGVEVFAVGGGAPTTGPGGDFLTEAAADALYAALDHDHPQVTTGEYRFSTSSAMADPGSGNLRSNTGSASTPTALAMDQLGAGGTDITTLFSAMRSADTVFLQDKDDATNWARYQLTGAATLHSGWAQVPVSVISSGGTIANNQLCVLQLTLTAGGGGGGGGAGTSAWVSFVLDGGGSAITTGQKGHFAVPAGEIEEVLLLADASGSIVLDLWRDTYTNYPPVVGDSICASAKPTLASAVKAQDTTLTGWSTTCSEGDLIAVNVDSAATISRCTLALKIVRA